MTRRVAGLGQAMLAMKPRAITSLPLISWCAGMWVAAKAAILLKINFLSVFIV
jgi:hypothetical protein